MTPGTGRWLAPLGASAAVLAVFVVPGVVAATGTSRAGVGPQQPRPVLTPNDPVTPPLAGPGQAEPRSGPPLVDVVGYRVNGRDLVRLLHGRPELRAARVRSRSRWSRSGAAPSGSCSCGGRSRATDEVCVDRIPTSSVDITLSRPLGGRLLQDAARGGALVPPIASLP